MCIISPVTSKSDLHCLCVPVPDGWMNENTNGNQSIVPESQTQGERKIECDAFICLLYFKFQIHGWKYLVHSYS